LILIRGHISAADLELEKAMAFRATPEGQAEMAVETARREATGS
jgi:hypothetical protein